MMTDPPFPAENDLFSTLRTGTLEGRGAYHQLGARWTREGAPRKSEMLSVLRHLTKAQRYDFLWGGAFHWGVEELWQLKQDLGLVPEEQPECFGSLLLGVDYWSLSEFRDAALTHSAAQAAQKPFYLEGPEEALEEARWLGLEFEPGPARGCCFLGPGSTRKALQQRGGLDLRWLPCMGEASNPSTRRFRERGFEGRSLFSALIYSIYGPRDSSRIYRASESFFEEKWIRFKGAGRESLGWPSGHLVDIQRRLDFEAEPETILDQVFPFWSEHQVALAAWKESLFDSVSRRCGSNQTLANFARSIALGFHSDFTPIFVELLEQPEEWTVDYCDEYIYEHPIYRERALCVDPFQTRGLAELFYDLGREFVSDLVRLRQL